MIFYLLVYTVHGTRLFSINVYLSGIVVREKKGGIKKLTLCGRSSQTSVVPGLKNRTRLHMSVKYPFGSLLNKITVLREETVWNLLLIKRKQLELGWFAILNIARRALAVMVCICKTKENSSSENSTTVIMIEQLKARNECGIRVDKTFFFIINTGITLDINRLIIQHYEIQSWVSTTSESTLIYQIHQHRI